MSRRDAAAGRAPAAGEAAGNAAGHGAAGGPLVAILAEDLIWAMRLSDFARASGASLVCGDVAALERTLADPRGVRAVLVDATARGYDPIAAVRAAVAAGGRVLVVAQHDDAELRRAALEAGASRVVPYRKMAVDGRQIVADWLAEAVAATGGGLR